MHMICLSHFQALPKQPPQPAPPPAAAACKEPAATKTSSDKASAGFLDIFANNNSATEELPVSMSTGN